MFTRALFLLLVFTVTALGTNPSVTYTFSNSTTADATEVNTNFNDLISAMTDGTKSFSIDACTVAGTATLNGDINLGNATTDDLVVTAALASNFIPDGNDTRALGSSSNGYSLLYMGNSTYTIGLQAPTLAASYTLTLPTAGGTDGYDLVTGGSGNTSWLHKQPGIYNVGVVNATTTDTNDSIKITGADGTALSSTNPAYVVMPAVTDGTLAIFKVTSDVTIKITGAHWGRGTVGDLSGYPLRLYAINSNGSLVWGITPFNIRTLTDSEDETTQTSVSTYSKVLVNSAVGSGTWEMVQVAWFKADFDDTGGASEDLWTVNVTPGSIRTSYEIQGTPKQGKVSTYGGNGHGSVNGVIRRFDTTSSNTSLDVVFADSSTAGASLTINSAGIYAVNYCDRSVSSDTRFGLSLNSAQLTTAIQSITSGRLVNTIDDTTNHSVWCVAWTGRLSPTDVVRPHTDSNTNATSADNVVLWAHKVSDY